MNTETPTIPSSPTRAISADAPFSMTWSSETMAVVGKYTWLNLAPDSCSESPRPNTTGSSCGCHRSHSGRGKAANKRFLAGWGGVIRVCFRGRFEPRPGTQSRPIPPKSLCPHYAPWNAGGNRRARISGHGAISDQASHRIADLEEDGPRWTHRTLPGVLGACEAQTLPVASVRQIVSRQADGPMVARHGIADKGIRVYL